VTLSYIAGSYAMKLPHRREFLHLAADVVALPALPRIVVAQTYPSRPITIVVGFAAGGSTDVIARMMAERMKSSLGKPVIVENVTGAAGTIAAGRVARAAPDGYTLSLGNNSSHVLPGATYALQYDLLNDFEPVALLSTGPYVLSARKTMPANDLKGLIAWLKANPDKATLGIGIPDIAGFYFQSETGTRFQFRALFSGSRSAHPGLGGRSDRHGDHRSDRRPASGASRHDQGFWDHHKDPAVIRA
jgi:tripartite-type tricarboxylate transporter receptor subunit TctC